jgi:hypothetical protein
VARDQSLNLRDNLRVSLQQKVGLNPILQYREAPFFQSRPLSDSERGFNISEGRSTPHGQGISKQQRRLARLACRQGVVSGKRQTLETRQIDGFRIDAQRISARTTNEQVRRLATLALGLHQLAELRHIHLQDVASGLGRLIAPQHLNQSLDTYDSIGLQYQSGQQRPLLATPKRNRMPMLDSLDRSQNAEVHLGEAMVHRPPGERNGASPLVGERE